MSHLLVICPEYRPLSPWRQSASGSGRRCRHFRFMPAVVITVALCIAAGRPRRRGSSYPTSAQEKTARSGATSTACAAAWSSAIPPGRVSSCSSADGWWSAVSAGCFGPCGPPGRLHRACRVRRRPVRRRGPDQPYADPSRRKLRPLEQALRALACPRPAGAPPDRRGR